MKTLYYSLSLWLCLSVRSEDAISLEASLHLAGPEFGTETVTFKTNSPVNIQLGDNSPPFRLLSIETNRVGPAVHILRVEPDTNSCPVCKAFHHEIHVVAKTSREWLLLVTECDGQVKSNVLREGVTRTWLETNVVQRTFHRQQPGQTIPVPPLPLPSTNKGTTFINQDPMGRTLVSAIVDGQLLPHEERR